MTLSSTPTTVLGSDGNRPNVVVIVLDDIGFADLGCYGSQIATPAMDDLAAHGLQYTNFHTTALCSPTRASLLTGCNHHSVGMGRLASFDTGEPGYRGEVSDEAVMLPQRLRDGGYSTFAVGKWHLVAEKHSSAVGPFGQWPLGRGFERYYGFLSAATNQWQPELVQDNHPIDSPRREAYHLSEDLVDQSIGMISTQKALAPDRPFFLYLAFGANHSPHHAPRSYIDPYVSTFADGWDAARDSRLARQIELGIAPPGTHLPARNDDVRPWSELTEKERRLAVELQAAYAGMLEHADAQIGRLMSFLSSRGELDNTMVVLLSDNGASDEGGPLGALNFRAYAYGVDDTVDDQLARLDEVGGPTLMNHYAAGWAMASNTPLRRYKWTSHAGGIRTPMIVRTPAGMAPAGLRRQFHHVIDVCPTILDVAGVGAAPTADDASQREIEGVSMRYTFADAETPTRRTRQHFEVVGCRGIWQQGWKAVAWHRQGADPDTDRWELYDIDNDMTESVDLASTRPDLLVDLQQAWLEEAERYHVVPLRDRTSKPLPRTDSRDVFVLPAGLRHVPSRVAPDIRNRSYRIAVDARLASGDDEGVLLAHGGPASGYSLYVQGGRLIHDYNYVGRHSVLRSTRALAAGRHLLEYRFRSTGDFRGEGTLLIDGVPAGKQELSATLPVLHEWEGLSVGCDAAAPVGDYDAPFPFSGIIDRLEVNLAPRQPPDPAVELAAEEREQ